MRKELEKQLQIKQIEFASVGKIAPYNILREHWIVTLCKDVEGFISFCKNAKSVELGETSAICFLEGFRAYIFHYGGKDHDF